METAVTSLELAEESIKSNVEALSDTYHEKFGIRPSFVVRIPGRY